MSSNSNSSSVSMRPAASKPYGRKYPKFDFFDAIPLSKKSDPEANVAAAIAEVSPSVAGKPAEALPHSGSIGMESVGHTTFGAMDDKSKDTLGMNVKNPCDAEASPKDGMTVAKQDGDVSGNSHVTTAALVADTANPAAKVSGNTEQELPSVAQDFVEQPPGSGCIDGPASVTASGNTPTAQATDEQKVAGFPKPERKKSTDRVRKLREKRANAGGKDIEFSIGRDEAKILASAANSYEKTSNGMAKRIVMEWIVAEMAKMGVATESVKGGRAT